MNSFISVIMVEGLTQAAFRASDVHAISNVQGAGTVIHFTDEDRLAVANSYDDVLAQLQSCK